MAAKLRSYVGIPATAIVAKIGILLVIFSLSEAQFLNYLQPRQPKFSVSSGSVTSRGLVYGGREILNGTKSTILEWEVNPLRSPKSTITFKFSTVRTSYNKNGIILLGLSKTGRVDGADVVAVIPSATTGELAQLVDMHGVNNSIIIPDSVQNWKLDYSDQNSSHVYFMVSRILDTGDEQDVPINNDLIRIIWGYTDADKAGNESFTFSSEGSVRKYLLDPRVPSSAASTRLKSWRMSTKFLVPPKRTTYWCTIHRGPSLRKKHHIVGFTAYFKDDTSRQHVHHKIVHYCIAPPGTDPAKHFEKYIRHPGEECYLENKHELPTTFCFEMVMAWGVGGQSFSLPSDVGLVIGDTRNDYFMFESHYNNPEIRSDLVVESGVDFFYTPDLRPKEGSYIQLGTGVFGMYLIPPHTENFKMAGQCSPACTFKMIPPTGVEIVSAYLHSHLAAHTMILRHFRGNRQLPVILSDHNYNFNYQQNRLLGTPVTVRAGDHLVVECHMDTRSRNATTLSGFATTEEMCMALIFLNKRLPYAYCTSEYPTEVMMEKYGITNMTWARDSAERIVNSARNPQFVGQPASKVIDEIEGKWTHEKVRELEMQQFYGNHESTCPSTTMLMRFGFVLQSVEDLTGGLFPGRALVARNTPSIRSISTRLDWFHQVVGLIRHFSQYGSGNR